MAIPNWQKGLAENADQFIQFVSKRVKSYELAEDLFQDAFLKALQSSEGPKDEEKARAWFYRILRNIIIDHYRSQASNEKKLADYEQNIDLLLESNNFKQLCFEYESYFASMLKPDDAEIIRQLDLEEVSIKDYANAHRMKEGTVRVKRHRARQKLKELILEVCRCLIEPDADCDCPDIKSV